jgi:MoxR-like ATPase
MTITDLQSRRMNAFLTACVKEGYSSPLKRSQIKAVKAKYSLPMPLWILRDDSRRTSHGLYEVPELNAHMTNNHKVTPIVTAINEPNEPTTTTLDLARRVETLEQEIENLIPRVISTYVPFGAYRDVEKVIRSGRFYPMYITGLSGNGKTTMVQQICATGRREFVRANITKETDEDDLLGGFRLVNGESVWVDGPAVIAMKRGAVLLLDEVDLNPDKIMCLQPVMEGNPIFLKKINQYVYPAKGFNIVATANTKGQGGEESMKFVGTSVMNEAFLERFAITIEHDYPSRAIERKIVLNMMKREECLDENFADNLVRWAETIRKTFAEGACDDIITTRRLEHIVVAYSIFRNRVEAVTKGVARFSKDTKQSFIDLYLKIDGEVTAVAAMAEEVAAMVAEEHNQVNIQNPNQTQNNYAVQA